MAEVCRANTIKFWCVPKRTLDTPRPPRQRSSSSYPPRMLSIAEPGCNIIPGRNTAHQTCVGKAAAHLLRDGVGALAGLAREGTDQVDHRDAAGRGFGGGTAANPRATDAAHRTSDHAGYAPAAPWRDHPYTNLSSHRACTEPGGTTSGPCQRPVNCSRSRAAAAPALDRSSTDSRRWRQTGFYHRCRALRSRPRWCCAFCATDRR